MARESSEAVPVMDSAKSADATTAATAAHATPATDVKSDTTDTSDMKTTKKTAVAAPTTTPHGPVGRTLTGPWGASFSGEGTTGLTFERRWTRPGVHPYDEINWEIRTAAIGRASCRERVYDDV